LRDVVQVPEVVVGDGEESSSVDDRFEAFVTFRGRRLRQALVSGFGPEVGEEATAEALAYGWSHRVAEVLGISESAVRTHHTRGPARLRKALGVIVDG
jgi:hypothetical protein